MDNKCNQRNCGLSLDTLLLEKIIKAIMVSKVTVAIMYSTNVLGVHYCATM
jgi:hypothetical protein